jgi:Asp-tRNA(Asn)/Glu-tRNA(Gln) amidotransferase B subunit
MKKVFYASGLLAMIASFLANADSFLRIKCDDQDVGAEVYINGKFVGGCPVDAPTPAGTVQIRARKIVNDDYEQLFEKQLSVVDGVAQRVEIIMSAPQLTAEAILRKKAAEANAQLRAAEAGDIAAMRKIAEYYDSGMGVEKNPATAKNWRGKAEVATAQEQLRAANAGNIEAMLNMATRYDTGQGVNKDPAQAQAWHAKSDAAKREKTAQEETVKRERMAQEKALEKQKKIDSISFFGATKYFYTDAPEGFKNPDADPSTVAIFATTWIVPTLATDLIAAPTRSTELHQIKNEAALRPSTWGKPDSMIAKASLQHNASSTTDKLVVAAK